MIIIDSEAYCPTQPLLPSTGDNCNIILSRGNCQHSTDPQEQRYDFPEQSVQAIAASPAITKYRFPYDKSPDWCFLFASDENKRRVVVGVDEAVVVIYGQFHDNIQGQGDR